MDRIKIASMSELVNSRRLIKRILGRSYLIQLTGDKVRVFRYICGHQGADLTSSKVEGNVVTCPKHGWQYNVETGECVQPGGEPLKEIECEVVEGEVYMRFNNV